MRMTTLISMTALAMIAASPALAQDAMAKDSMAGDAMKKDGMMSSDSKMKMSMADKKKMTACKGMSHDMMMKDAGCMKMMKMHPAMMKKSG